MGGSVEIVGTDVIFTPTANYDGPASFEYTVRDNGTSYGNNDFKTDVGSVSFTITPGNDAPQITSGDAFSIEEGNTAITTVTATDVELNAISFSITGGEDQSFFAIDEDTGALRFIGAPYFEVSADFDHDNFYEVVVTATDTLGAHTDQAITVEVTNGPGVTINGTAAANVINATQAPAGQPLPTNNADTINGKGGNDTIRALGGNDLIDGGIGVRLDVRWHRQRHLCRRQHERRRRRKCRRGHRHGAVFDHPHARRQPREPHSDRRARTSTAPATRLRMSSSATAATTCSRAAWAPTRWMAKAASTRRPMPHLERV